MRGRGDLPCYEFLICKDYLNGMNWPKSLIILEEIPVPVSETDTFKQSFYLRSSVIMILICPEKVNLFY